MLPPPSKLDFALSTLAALALPMSESERHSLVANLLETSQLSEAAQEVAEMLATTTDPSDQADNLIRTMERIRDTETARIIDRLKSDGDSTPTNEILEMRRHKEWFTPILIREFQEAVNYYVQRHGNPNPPFKTYNSLPFFAYFLFVEWRVKESVPVVMQALKLPGEDAFELLCFSIDRMTPIFLAHFFSDDLDQIDALILDRNISEYVRLQGADSYKYLVRDGKLKAIEATKRLEALFYQSKAAGEDGLPTAEHNRDVSSAILDSYFHTGGSMPAIFSDQKNLKFVDGAIVALQDYDVEEEDETLKHLQKTLGIDDTDCLNEIPCCTFFTSGAFPEYETRSDASSNDQDNQDEEDFTDTFAVSQTALRPGTVRNTDRTPRNAKCPCGSGKKFKQCCLRNEST